MKRPKLRLGSSLSGISLELKGVKLRELRITDIFSLHRMYHLLSDESKFFFHPPFLGLRPESFRWFITQTELVLSTIKPLCNLLLIICPNNVFLPLVAVNERNKVIAFGFLKIWKELSSDCFLAELGIVINDVYQGRGLGSRLMKNLIELARKVNIRAISLVTHPKNARAIGLYTKYGFKQTRTIKSGDRWCGRTYDFVEMLLYLG